MGNKGFTAVFAVFFTKLIKTSCISQIYEYIHFLDSLSHGVICAYLGLAAIAAWPVQASGRGPSVCSSANSASNFDIRLSGSFKVVRKVFYLIAFGAFFILILRVFA